MRWNVGTKIGLGFSVALAIFVVVGVVSYGATTRLVEASEWRKHTYEVLAEFAELESQMHQLENGQRSFLLTGDGYYLDMFRSASGSIAGSLNKARELTRDNPEQQQRLDQLQKMVESRMDLARDTVDAFRSKGLEPALAFVKSGRGKELGEALTKLILAMQEDESRLLETRVAAADASTENAKLAIVFGTLAAVLAGALAAFLIARNIGRPLQLLTGQSERIMVGDLNVHVRESPRSDEVGMLERAFVRMTQALRGMAGVAEQIASGDLRSTVKPLSSEDVLGNAFARMSVNLRQQIGGMVEGAQVLGSAASEIVASTSQLAAGASQSAAAVNETTTTVEEIRQTSQMASQKARLVSDNAQTAAQITQSGRKSIEDMAAGMARIRQQMDAIAESMMRLSEQGHTIGQIIATVEDLAAQSNLLAVNAAIEAAKAGEQGKGFGVVAQEVKSLAEQSKQATERVRTILGDIQKATTAAVMATEQGSKAVEAGTRQTEVAGESITNLSATVTEAAQAATQIAASSQQQLVGMDQVAVAMESIKQASTQNVASAKQLENAARNLSELGHRLKQMVERYAVQ
jgi:methyl-accepting chemotaxis protein